MVKQNEFIEYSYTLVNVNPYPNKGSTGMYIHDIGSKLSKGKISDVAFRLFIYIVTDVNEYNQTQRSRREFAEALDIKYDAKRMSVLVKELIEDEWIAIFDNNIITVNPLLVIPSAKEIKFKSALQEAWRDIVEYGK